MSAPREEEPRGPNVPQDRDLHRCPIVAMGASAGGLEPLRQFFAHMPSDSGIGFVLVTHLDPGRESMLAELIGRHTDMPVHQAGDRTPVKPNAVWVIPPNTTLTIENGVLRTTPHPGPRHRVTPIDARRAAYGQMPGSAAATGVVDYVLPVEEMPERLVAYVGHLNHVDGTRVAEDLQGDARQHLASVLAMLRARTGLDFGNYKEHTIVRRVQRRMQVVHTPTPADYVQYLRENPTEVERLSEDLTIGVTQFFRDPGCSGFSPNEASYVVPTENPLYSREEEVPGEPTLAP